MRLVMVVSRFPRTSETFIASKFAGLIDAGWDVHVVCGRESPAVWDKISALAGRPELRRRVHVQGPHEQAWRVVLLWLPLFLSTLARAPRTLWRYWRSVWPQFGWRTIKHFYLDAPIIALSPDILHFEFGALAVGRTYLKEALGCFLSASFRGYDLNHVGLENPEHYTGLWETSDAIHVLGSDLWHKAMRRGCPAGKAHAIIPPAIDAAYFVPNEEPHRDGEITARRPLRILSVGRLEWVKGLEYGLKAVKLLGEQGVTFEYRIIGDGGYFEALTFIRHDLGLDEHVSFLGGQSQPFVLKQMEWADVFLHPSVSEGFSNAVMEAQAMRLPVVASDAGGLPENVANGLTGFIVPRRDPEALANRLAILAKEGELRSEMGAAGRKRVERCFNLPEQIAAFDRFYRDMVGPHAS